LTRDAQLLQELTYFGCSTFAFVFRSITSQRGSAWHCLIGRFLSEGKTRFSTYRLKKQMNILETNLAGVIMSVKSTNSPNLVQIGCEMAPPHGGEI